jgi:Recombination endonuclease VII
VRLAHTDRVGSLRRKYKLSPAEHGRMFRGQNKKCWVCGRRGVRLVVDHDHRRRRVRALLCDTDNKVEGLLAKIGVRTMRQLEMWAVQMAALRTEARW